MASSQKRRRSPRRAVHEPLEQRYLFGAGGGWTSAGIYGEYYNNTTLTAPSSFTRRDVRIDFDWGSVMKPGGSVGAGYSDLGTDNYSVRWTGQLMARFSEEYTFRATADDTFKLEIKPTSSSTWTTLIDQTAYTGSESVGRYVMAAGGVYDTRITYKELTGNAKASLKWSSANTPLEVIEPLQNNGYLVDGRGGYMFADMVKTARTAWGSGTTDAYGWPTGDSGLLVWEGDSTSAFGGTYNVQFKGRAAVASYWVSGVNFIVNGTSYGNTLSFGLGWNSTTNLTTFQMVVPTTANSPFYFQVSNTRRLATDTTATGITDLKIMRPTTMGGSTPYGFNQLYTNNFKAAADVFTEFRWLDTNGNLAESNWSQRVKPYYSIGVNRGGNTGIVNKGWIYEYQIMFCNEMGKDLYVTIPMRATNDYMLNLARLIRYGSDATGTPYSAPTANPVYPPLNPNLKVYLEVSNEVWNFAGGFEQTRQADDDAYAAYLASSPEWNVINYDNSVSTSDTGGSSTFDFKRLCRWYALRTVRMSEQFRSVYGDALMGSSIRPLLFWQYNNANNTALYELKFLDDYFNNRDGITHVATPRPLSYYLWGAGGASYYGSGNNTGTLAVDPIVNSSFDSGGLPLGVATVRPTIPGWTFVNNAGVYGSGSSSYTSDGKSMGALPAPATGSYAAYIMRGGKIRQSITFTSSGKYAIGFTARGSNTFPIDVFLGGTRITPLYKQYRGSGEPYAASGAEAIESSWNIDVSSGWQSVLTTAVVDVVVPQGQSSITLTFEIGNPDTSSPATDYLLFDKFYVASADRLYDGGIPDTGQALGQVAAGPWASDRKDIAEYVLAYGIKPASYESGWSLGGDSGSSPFQNTLKYYDSRSMIANNVAIDTHNEAGYGMVTYGVYSQWNDEQVDSAANSYLRQSFDAKNNMLPVMPTNGEAIGTALTTANQYVSYEGSGTSWSYIRNASASLRPHEWIGWNVIVPTRSAWRITPTTAAGGTAEIIVDNVVVATFTSGSGATQPSIGLAPGIHSIRVRSKTGTFNFTSLSFARIAAPTFSSFAVNDGSAQRSMVNSLQVVFSTPVTVSGDAFALTNRSGASLGISITPSNPLADGRTYVLRFSGGGVSAGSLPDGMYRLQLRTAEVTDPYAQAVAGGNLTFAWHRLFGDADGDRDVDNSDLKLFKATLNKPLSYLWYFDHDQNGSVTNSDYLQFKQRLIRLRI